MSANTAEVTDTPLEKRVYNMGMRLMQQAIKARMEGKDALANTYQEKFFALCSAIESKPIAEVAHTVQDDVMVSLNTLNNGRITLANELNQSIAIKDQTTAKAIVEALQSAKKSCQIMQLCLKKALPPPQIERHNITLRIPALNNYISKDEMALNIHKLDADGVKGRQYVFRVLPPVANACAKTSDIIEPGEQEIELRFKCIDRDNVDRILRRRLTIELHMLAKKLFGKVEFVPVATLVIPLSVFSQHKSMRRTFVMTPIPDGPLKNEQFMVDVSVDLHSSLVTPEFEEKSFEYWTIAKGAKLEFPAETPAETPPNGTIAVETPAKRIISQLNADEKRELTAALKACRLLEPWELSRFMGLSVLKPCIEETNALIAVFEKLNVEIPVKVIEQKQTLQKRQTQLITGLSEKRLTIAVYRDMLKKQVDEDVVEAQKRKGTPAGEALLNRVKIMQAELAKLAPKGSR